MSFKKINFLLFTVFILFCCNPFTVSGDEQQITNSDLIGEWKFVDWKGGFRLVDNNMAIVITNDGMKLPATYTLINNTLTLFLIGFGDDAKFVMPIKQYETKIMKIYESKSKRIVTLKRVK